MTTIPMATSRQRLFESHASHRQLKPDRGLIVAAALFLAVAIVELAIIALASPGIAEIGSLYVSTT